MLRTILNKKGFTLIELTTAIVIVSILSVMAGMGLVQIANGYLLAKQSTVAAQQAQVALARIAKEISAIQSIDQSLTNSAKLRYSRSDGQHTLAWDAGSQILTLDDDKLLEKVQSFTLAYHSVYNGEPGSYSAATTIIELSFELTGYGNTPLVFFQRMNI